MKRIHQPQFRAHGLAGGQAVHHVDQGILAFAGQRQHLLAAGQAAGFHRAVAGGQSRGQGVNFVETGGGSAAGKQLQLVAQFHQLFGLFWMLGPLVQQLLRVHDQVHAFGKEHGKDVWIRAGVILVGQPVAVLL